jgi:hypothetical protein
MAEPVCWAISSRKARSGSRRISKRYPTSSHHKDRVHTLAPRPTRGIGFNGWNPGTKKRPAYARRSASVALFGHTPTTTCRSVTIGQAVGQVSWSTVVGLPAVAPKSGQSGHQRVGVSSGRGAGQGRVALVGAGSVRHRKPLVRSGHERSCPANQNRRSHGLHRFDLVRENGLVPGSNPSAPLARLILRRRPQGHDSAGVLPNRSAPSRNEPVLPERPIRLDPC